MALFHMVFNLLNESWNLALSYSSNLYPTKSVRLDEG
jgi:hypothetical protein